MFLVVVVEDMKVEHKEGAILFPKRWQQVIPWNSYIAFHPNFVDTSAPLSTIKTMDRIREIFEELNFPGAERLKKALKNRGIPFTKEQVNEITKGESVRQIQQAAPRLTGKVASHYQNYEWMADLIDWTTAPAQSGATSRPEGPKMKQDPERFILVVQDVFPRKMLGRTACN